MNATKFKQLKDVDLDQINGELLITETMIAERIGIFVGTFGVEVVIGQATKKVGK